MDPAGSMLPLGTWEEAGTPSTPLCEGLFGGSQGIGSGLLLEFAVTLGITVGCHVLVFTPKFCPFFTLTESSAGVPRSPETCPNSQRRLGSTEMRARLRTARPFSSLSQGSCWLEMRGDKKPSSWGLGTAWAGQGPPHWVLQNGLSWQHRSMSVLEFPEETAPLRADWGTSCACAMLGTRALLSWVMTEVAASPGEWACQGRRILRGVIFAPKS